MEGSLEVQKVRRYKDGETRDRRGRWAGKVVTVRKEYYALIEAWQRQTGMSKAQFWREAVMRGAVEIAKSRGIEAAFPTLEDKKSADGVQVKYKRRFPAWLFRKSVPSNGLRYLRWGGGRRSRPARKMVRRRKLLEIAAESPASGARFVRQPLCLPKRWLKKDTTANTPNFYT